MKGCEQLFSPSRRGAGALSQCGTRPFSAQAPAQRALRVHGAGFQPFIGLVRRAASPGPLARAGIVRAFGAGGRRPELRPRGMACAWNLA